MTSAPKLAPARLSVFLVAILAFGGVALAMGMDADWDLRNYHYYNAWALLTGREGRDFLVSQIPTFYNPTLDVPYFLLAQILPARALAFALGMLHAGNFILLTLLGERLLDIDHPWRRFGVASLLAGAGCAGAVALSEVGTVFYDNILSQGLFASLLLVVAQWDRVATGHWRRALTIALLAGLPVGLAFGLKQTTAMFPVGLCAALLLTLPATPARRFFAAFAFGIGVLGAAAVGGGYWMWHLWHLYGNPVFPHFNQLFQSPWALPEPYRDGQYLGGIGKRLLFPFVFSFDTRQASEIVFRDFRILAAFVVIPLAGLWLAARGALRIPPAARFTRAGPAAFVLISTAIAYVIWLQLFAIYRYLTAVEMLAPLLVALSLDLFPGPVRARLAAAVGAAAALVLTTQPGEWIRVPFSDKPVQATVPPIASPDRTIVLLAGHEPLSFLLPSFPPAVQFVRIDSTFTNPDQTAVRFNRVMRDLVARHQGPLLALYIPTEAHDVRKRLGNYDLTLEDKGCRTVTSPIGAAPYRLCPVAKPVKVQEACQQNGLVPVGGTSCGSTTGVPAVSDPDRKTGG